LDQLVGASGEETLEEVLEDTNTPAPEREALRLLFQEELRNIIDYIPTRQASALRLHYGLEDGIP
jgi:DNA-directed RNA polymerase sigma subunit (sigma70/sigma32)